MHREGSLCIFVVSESYSKQFSVRLVKFKVKKKKTEIKNSKDLKKYNIHSQFQILHF